MPQDRYIIDPKVDPDSGYVVVENLRTRQRLRFTTAAEAQIYIRAEGGVIIGAGEPR